MSEKSIPEQIAGAAAALTALSKAVLVYEDAIRPAAKEIGKTGEALGKAVNALLLPLQGMVWGFNKIADLLTRELPRRLEAVPPENLQTPPPNVAVPVIESLRYTADEPTLRGMYLNLLSAAMDARTVASAHPAFAEIIRQLTPDEALILDHFGKVGHMPVLWFRTATCTEQFSLVKEKSRITNPQCLHLYLANLHRLNLLSTSDGSLESSAIHEEMVKFSSHPEARARQDCIAKCHGVVVDQHGLMSLTDLGKAFVRVVLNSQEGAKVASPVRSGGRYLSS
jgi:hypothetical protein